MLFFNSYRFSSSIAEQEPFAPGRGFDSTRPAVSFALDLNNDKVVLKIFKSRYKDHDSIYSILFTMFQLKVFFINCRINMPVKHYLLITFR